MVSKKQLTKHVLVTKKTLNKENKAFLSWNFFPCADFQIFKTNVSLRIYLVCSHRKSYLAKEQQSMCDKVMAMLNVPYMANYYVDLDSDN